MKTLKNVNIGIASGSALKMKPILIPDDRDGKTLLKWTLWLYSRILLKMNLVPNMVSNVFQNIMKNVGV